MSSSNSEESNWAHSVKLIWASLDREDFHLALDYIRKLRPQTTSMNRERWHLYAKVCIGINEFHRAKVILNKTRALYGIHLGLLCDQIVVAFKTGNFVDWYGFIAELIAEFDAAKDHLSFDTMISTRIFLLQVLEERGNISSAMSGFIELINDEKLNAKINTPTRISILSQLLRLCATYRESKYFSAVYAELSQYCWHDLCDVYKLELLHSLMIAELEKLGLDRALYRLQTITTIAGKNTFWHRLAFFDLVEQCIFVLRVDRSKLSKLDPLRPSEGLDPYETLLNSIVFEKNSKKVASIDQIDYMLPCIRLRALSLVSAFGEPSEASEALTKLKLILSGYSIEDQKTWNHYLLDSGDTSYPKRKDNEIIKLDTEQASISFGASTVSFSRSKVAFTTLTLLAKNPTMTFKELIFLLWQGKEDQSHYDRLRMLIKRINQKLALVTGEENCILWRNDLIRTRFLMLIE